MSRFDPDRRKVYIVCWTLGTSVAMLQSACHASRSAVPGTPSDNGVKARDMGTYARLNTMPAESFLNPDNFKTDTDHLPEKGYAEQQFQKGLRISNESKEVGVGAGGTWWAAGKDGSHTTSYEGIGYHSCTADLLRGLLAGSAKFIVYRWTENGITETCIKE